MFCFLFIIEGIVDIYFKIYGFLMCVQFCEGDIYFQLLGIEFFGDVQIGFIKFILFWIGIDVFFFVFYVYCIYKYILVLIVEVVDLIGLFINFFCYDRVMKGDDMFI